MSVEAVTWGITTSFADRSLTELAEERGQLDSRKCFILHEALTELRIVYFTMEETKEAGYLETEHFGVEFPQRHSDWGLTDVPQRWLRDLLWEHLADRLRSSKGPRSTGPLDNDRRSCVELGAFLEITAPGGGHNPRLLDAEHISRTVTAGRPPRRNGSSWPCFLPAAATRRARSRFRTPSSTPASAAARRPRHRRLGSPPGTSHPGHQSPQARRRPASHQEVPWPGLSADGRALREGCLLGA